MRALTLTQPWATLVAVGEKRVETRSWSTRYRGPIAIHAAKGINAEACEFADDLRCYNVLTRARPLSTLPRGMIVATARLVDCQPTIVAVRDHRIDEQEAAFGNYHPERYAWFLEDIREVIPCVEARGALGLWEWSA
jgi:activating signal cointegrator 1